MGEINTFGAILGYAIKLEELSAEHYRKIINNPLSHDLNSFIQNVITENSGNSAKLNIMKHKNINEMILEPVTDFYEKEYEVDDIMKTDYINDQDMINDLIEIEHRIKRYYAAALDKTRFIMPDASRNFEKLSKMREKRVAGLLKFMI